MDESAYEPVSEPITITFKAYIKVNVFYSAHSLNDIFLNTEWVEVVLVMSMVTSSYRVISNHT